MKRTCNYCIANLTVGHIDHGCELGFKIELIPNKFRRYTTTQKPAEECPKPLTLKRFVELKLAKDQKQEVV
jgi:hypothetical protein